MGHCECQPCPCTYTGLSQAPPPSCPSVRGGFPVHFHGRSALQLCTEPARSQLHPRCPALQPLDWASLRSGCGWKLGLPGGPAVVITLSGGFPRRWAGLCVPGADRWVLWSLGQSRGNHADSTGLPRELHPLWEGLRCPLRFLLPLPSFNFPFPCCAQHCPTHCNGGLSPASQISGLCAWAWSEPVHSHLPQTQRCVPGPCTECVCSQLSTPVSAVCGVCAVL